MPQRPSCGLVLVLLLLVLGSASTRGDVEQLYGICEDDALCRNLFQQEHGEMSILRFKAMLNHLPSVAPMDLSPEIANNTLLRSLIADRMSLYHLVYSESQCPPNQYWRWNETTATGTCTCYLDRDCRVNVLSLCHPQVHPILLGSFVIVICFQFALVVLQNFCPPKKASKRKSERI